MTKKDYIAIANAIKNVRKLGAIGSEKLGLTNHNQIELVSNEIVKELVTIFKIDNPRFDRQRFIDYINK